jgi:hypothetical protein
MFYFLLCCKHCHGNLLFKSPGRSGSFQEKSLPAFPTPGRLADIFSAVNSCSFGAEEAFPIAVCKHAIHNAQVFKTPRL